MVEKDMAVAKFGRKLAQRVIVRARGLLPMLYTPRELEEELGVPSRSVREWIKKGMPYQRDGRSILINGREFAGWIESVRKSGLRSPLECDEAYCLKCKKPVPLTNLRESRKGQLRLVQGKCPCCGRTVNRGGRVD
jgi:excisionase family DNA binding protein